MSSLLETQELQIEQDIQRNPYNLKAWLNLLLLKRDASSIARYVVYERAVVFLPRSYKLWHAYLQERTATLAHSCIIDPRFSILINAYERALVNMYKMPRIW